MFSLRKPVLLVAVVAGLFLLGMAGSLLATPWEWFVDAVTGVSGWLADIVNWVLERAKDLIPDGAS